MHVARGSTDCWPSYDYRLMIYAETAQSFRNCVHEHEGTGACWSFDVASRLRPLQYRRWALP